MIATYALNLFDLVATTLWVNAFGIGIEGNPIGRWLYGQGLVYPVKILLVGGLLIVLYFALKAYPRLRWVSLLPLGVYGLVAIYHLVGAFYVSQMF